LIKCHKQKRQQQQQQQQQQQLKTEFQFTIQFLHRNYWSIRRESRSQRGKSNSDKVLE
jgi:hypothetical protein